MTPLTGKTVAELLDAFSSSDPTPGGGSASALASAIGVSLAMMVAALPKTRTNADEERERLREAHGALRSHRGRLTDLVDEDSAAYDAVVQAYQLPKDTDGQKAARKAQIQVALRRATEVPLEVMRSSVAALEGVRVVAASSNRAAASDVGVAVALLDTGVRGAGLNVRINLDGLADRGVADTLAREAAELERRASDVVREAGELARA